MRCALLVMMIECGRGGFTSIGWRNVSGSVEKDRDVDVSNPAIGVPPVEEIH